MKARRDRIRPKRPVKIGVGVYGLPDGSVLIRPGQSSRAPKLRFQGEPPLDLGSGEIVWDNPPGPSQGVSVGLQTGVHYIGPKDLVTPTQASELLGKSRVWIYKLIHSGKLRPVKKPGAGTMLIPLSQIKRLRGTTAPEVRPIHPGALWGYDRNGLPWLLG